MLSLGNKIFKAIICQIESIEIGKFIYLAEEIFDY